MLKSNIQNKSLLNSKCLYLPKHCVMKKRPFNPEQNMEAVRIQIKGKLRIQLYLYMEDNDCTLSEALRDGIRVVTAKQGEDFKKGRKPK